MNDRVESILIILLVPCVRRQSLAHRISISEFLAWDRKSYLNHATLPRRSREGYALVVLELMRQSRQMPSMLC